MWSLTIATACIQVVAARGVSKFEARFERYAHTSAALLDLWSRTAKVGVPAQCQPPSSDKCSSSLRRLLSLSGQTSSRPGR